MTVINLTKVNSPEVKFRLRYGDKYEYCSEQEYLNSQKPNFVAESDGKDFTGSDGYLIEIGVNEYCDYDGMYYVNVIGAGGESFGTTVEKDKIVNDTVDTKDIFLWQ